MSLSLSLKNSLDQTFRKLKKEENKRPETGFCINRQKIRSYEDKRRIWQHKVRQIRTSNEYSASNSNLHRCIFTGFSRETYRGSFARERDATLHPNMIEDARQKGEKEKKMQMRVPERVTRCSPAFYVCVSVEHRVYNRTISCVAWS